MRGRRWRGSTSVVWERRNGKCVCITYRRMCIVGNVHFWIGRLVIFRSIVDCLSQLRESSNWFAKGSWIREVRQGIKIAWRLRQRWFEAAHGWRCSTNKDLSVNEKKILNRKFTNIVENSERIGDTPADFSTSNVLSSRSTECKIGDLGAYSGRESIDDSPLLNDFFHLIK